MEFAMTATLLENCFCLAAISEPKGRFLFSLAAHSAKSPGAYLNFSNVVRVEPHSIEPGRNIIAKA
jgi:hypothetical protein